jgi:hypothetical protein
MQALLLIEGQKHGPYELAEVIKFCELGQLGRDDLCWTERLAGWTPLSSVPEFAAVFASKPPEIPQTINSQGSRTPVESDQQKNYKQSKLSWASLLAGLILGGMSGWQLRDAQSPHAATAVQNSTTPTQKSFSEAKPSEAKVVWDKPEDSKPVEPAPIPPDEIVLSGARTLGEIGWRHSQKLARHSSNPFDTSNYLRGTVLVSSGARGVVSGTIVYPIRLRRDGLPVTVYYAQDTFGEWVVFVEDMPPIPCNPNG